VPRLQTLIKNSRTVQTSTVNLKWSAVKTES